MKPSEFKIDPKCPFEPTTPVKAFLEASGKAQGDMCRAIYDGKGSAEIARLTAISEEFGRLHKRLVRAQHRHDARQGIWVVA